MKRGYWKTREGKILKIKDMEINHLYNTMRFVAGSIAIDKKYNRRFTNKQIIKHIKILKGKYAELERELNRRI